MQNGYAFKSGDLKESGIPVIKIKNIQPPNISLDEADCFPHELTAKLNQFIVKKKDILISMTGSHISQISSAVGKVGRYGFDKPALLNQRVGKLYSKDTEKLNDDFLYYYISRPEVQFELATNAGGSANQANISPQHIKDLEIEVPSIEAQRRIAEILFALDDKIELNRRMNQTLEFMAQTLFQKLFNSEECDSWDIVRLGDLIDIKGGYSYEGKFIGSGDAYLLGMGCVSFKDRFIFSGARPYSGDCKDAYLVKPGDIIIATRQQSDNLPILGFPAIVPISFKHKKVIVGTNLYKVFNKSDLNNNLLFQLLKSDNYKNHILSNSKGSTVRMITKDSIENYEFKMPTKERLQLYQNTFITIGDKLESNIEQSRKLSQLRDTLLPKLMSGEIDVMQTKLDELHEPVLS